MIRPKGDAKLHLWLTNEMAKAAGVDLSIVLREARLRKADYSTLVNRCRDCDRAIQCFESLRDGLETAPDLCRNTRILRALAA